MSVGGRNILLDMSWFLLITFSVVSCFTICLQYMSLTFLNIICSILWVWVGEILYWACVVISANNAFCSSSFFLSMIIENYWNHIFDLQGIFKVKYMYTIISKIIWKQNMNIFDNNSENVWKTKLENIYVIQNEK